MRKKSTSQIVKELKGIHEGVSLAFSKVKDELSEHLDSINKNTSELDLVYQKINYLEQMLDKIVERLDELTLSRTNVNVKFSDEKIDLSLREQEIFVILYTSNNSLSVVDLTRFSGLTEDLVHTYILRMISKGVPVSKSIVDDVIFYGLDSSFKHFQAKNNVVSINEDILNEFNFNKKVYNNF